MAFTSVDREARPAMSGPAPARLGKLQELYRRLQGPGVRYAASMVACHMMNGVAGVLAMRWLDPVALGWWSSAQMAKVPLDASRMGILNGMNREYPFLIGSGETKRAHRMLEAGLFHTLIMLGICQMGVAIAVLLLRDRSPMLVFGLVATSLVWSFTYYTQFVRSMLRTAPSFGLTGTIDFVVTALDAAAVLAVWRWGYYGLIARAVVTAGITAAAFRRFQPVQVSPHFDWEALVRMFRFGRHAFLTSYMNLVGQQAERVLLLAAVDGVRLVGLYTPAILCTSFLQVVPGAFQSYFYPQLVESFGRKPDAPKLTRALFAQIRRAMLVMVPISLAVAVGIGILIRWLLPHYAEGERAAMVVCLAGPFYPLRMCTSYYAALHQWRDYYFYSGIQTLLPYAMIWLFQRWMPTLEATAFGFVLANIFAGAVLAGLTKRHAARAAAATA